MARGGSRHRVAEFFAGAGLARLGLESSGSFEVIWANDVDRTKAALYRTRFGFGRDDHLQVGDIRRFTVRDIPNAFEVAWASFPCTDVSLAGEREGLDGAESGTWWAFVELIGAMRTPPPVIVAENVVGLATSHGGMDLELLLRGLNDVGYVVDVLAVDARHFVPQSRVRLFVIATLDTNNLLEAAEDHPARPRWLASQIDASGVKTFRPALPPLPDGPSSLEGFLEEMEVDDARWWPRDRVDAFKQGLSVVQLERLTEMAVSVTLRRRTAYRRTRHGRAVWEIRPDEIAGCLRTVRGGSSKQAVVEAGTGDVRVRWMTPFEYASLMGCSSYPINGFRPNQVYFGFGDAVVVPVVQWIAEHYLGPLLDNWSPE